jgi:hypothetical protein
MPARSSRPRGRRRRTSDLCPGVGPYRGPSRFSGQRDHHWNKKQRQWRDRVHRHVGQGEHDSDRLWVDLGDRVSLQSGPEIVKGARKQRQLVELGEGTAAQACDVTAAAVCAAIGRCSPAHRRRAGVPAHASGQHPAPARPPKPMRRHAYQPPITTMTAAGSGWNAYTVSRCGNLGQVGRRHTGHQTRSVELSSSGRPSRASPALLTRPRGGRATGWARCRVGGSGRVGLRSGRVVARPRLDR